MILLGKIKKNSLVYSLQIIAVLIIFLYPGNAATSVLNVNDAGKAILVNKKNTIPAGNTGLEYEAGDTLYLPGYPESEIIKYALITGNRK